MNRWGMWELAWLMPRPASSGSEWRGRAGRAAPAARGGAVRGGEPVAVREGVGDGVVTVRVALGDGVLVIVGEPLGVRVALLVGVPLCVGVNERVTDGVGDPLGVRVGVCEAGGVIVAVRL